MYKEFNREKHDAEMKLGSEELEIRKKEVDTNSDFMANICQTMAAMASTTMADAATTNATTKFAFRGVN